MFTFLTYLIAQVQTTAPVANPADQLAATTLPPIPAVPVQDAGIWSHVMDSDPLVKFVLFVLVGFSVGCWAVIFYKWTQLKSAQSSSQTFWSKFSAASSLADIVGAKGMRKGPLYEIFMSGQESLSKVKKGSTQYTQYLRDYVQNRLRQTQEEEMFKLEQYVSFLATTASVAPFIGLFGTVWGILNAFMKIGQAGSSSLSTVGPFIAEALIATAVGLFAAIPAVVAYNYFVGKIKIIGKLINLFVDDFMLKSEREMAS